MPALLPLAAVIAISARRSKVAASLPWSGARAMPRVTRTSALTSANRIEPSTRDFTAIAASRATSLPAAPGIASANWSPPTRATSAPCVGELSSRRATSASTLSPASWPSMSLTSWNRSMFSRTSTPPAEPSRVVSRKDRRLSRLARPVSLSRVAARRRLSTRRPFSSAAASWSAAASSSRRSPRSKACRLARSVRRP